MNQQPSYEELQKKISLLENEISELKLNQNQLPYSINKNRFFEICEYSTNAIALFESNDQGKTFIIKYFNKKAEEIEGVNRDFIIGRELSEKFPSVLKSGFYDAIKRVYKSNTSEEFPAVVYFDERIIEWKHNYIYKLSDKEVVSIFIDQTDQKQKEYELKEHQDKLQLAMEAANQALIDWDIKNDNIYFSPEWFKMLGYDPGMDFNYDFTVKIAHPDDVPEAVKKLQAHMKGESEIFEAEVRTKTKSGLWKWILTHGKIVERDKDGLPSRAIGIQSDITNIKNAEQQLRNSEEKFKSLATLLPEVIYETDIRGNLTFANLKAFEIFEYTQEDFNKGLNIGQMIAPEDLPRAQKNIKKILRNQNIVGVEYTALTKTGKRFPILVYSNVIIESGVIKGLRGIIVNITDFQKVQEDLKISEEKFRQLAENINDAFWLRSLDQKIIYFNPACKVIINENFKEIFEDFNVYKQWIHPDDREMIINKREKNQLNPHRNHYYEHRIIKPDGSVNWLWIRTFPVYNDKGELYRRAGIASDITAHKNLLNQLMAAKNRAEESDRLKSAFLANMSHEIRTPMNGILGFAELLKDPGITVEEKDNYIKIIDSNGKQLLNLINDIIDIAKIEADQLSINKTVFEINPFLEEVFSVFQEEQKRQNKKNIDFSLHIPHDKQNAVFTDNLRLQQIFNNLLNNAFKFTDHGNISFGYKIINDNGNQNYRFFVADTGTGIVESMQSLIFERFGQDYTIKYKNQHGTGLGLAICKGLIDLLGGEIWVESSPENLTALPVRQAGGLSAEQAGKAGGSTFYFTIPLIDKTNLNEKKIADNKKKKIMKTLEDLTILVVEDDEDNLEFLKRLLMKSGANVIVARSGEEAIKIIKSENTIKIVLMDIRLPDIDGFETTQKIKSLRPNISVIAQTAYAMYNDRELCLENGCDDYIAKPLDKEILFKKINDYIYN